MNLCWEETLTRMSAPTKWIIGCGWISDQESVLGVGLKWIILVGEYVITFKCL